MDMNKYQDNTVFYGSIAEEAYKTANSSEIKEMSNHIFEYVADRVLYAFLTDAENYKILTGKDLQYYIDDFKSRSHSFRLMKGEKHVSTLLAAKLKIIADELRKLDGPDISFDGKEKNN